MTTAGLSEAKELLRQGRADEAGSLCQRAIKSAPKSAAAWSLMGQILLKTRKLKPAYEHFRQAATLEPDNPAHLIDTGHVLTLGGKVREAEKVLKQAEAKGAAEPRLLHDLGGVYLMTERYSEAAEVFSKACTRVRDQAWPFANLGIARHRLGDLTGAAEAYRKAILLDPRDDNAHYNLGSVMGELLDDESALTSFEETLRLNPDRADVHKSIGNIKLTAGDYVAAVPFLKKAIALNPRDGQSRISLTYALAFADQAPEAIDLCKKIIARAPKLVAVHNNLAFAYLRNGRPEEAIGACDAALRLKPGSTSALSYKSAALNELGRRSEASDILGIDTLVRAKVGDLDGLGYDCVEAFNAAFCAYIMAHPTLAYTKNNRTLSAGQCTLDIFDGSDDPVIVAFQSMIERAVQDYKDALPVRPEHPFLFRHPAKHRIFCWANVMDSSGFHDTHYHPTGWLSGVYYPQLPGSVRPDDPSHEAWIEFGRAYHALKSADNPPVRVIMPEEGMIVLFPSYVGHRTIPFVSDEKRISVAFDVEPLD